MGFVGPSHITPEQRRAIQEIQLAEQFAWLFEQIREMSISDLGNVLSYNSGTAKGRED
jgi:hypothetical protein